MAAFFPSVLSAGAQTITVAKPAAHDPWIKGQTYGITWTKTGTMPDKVRINLRNKASTAVVQEIVDGAPNSGTFQWPVPTGIQDGEYCIRVKVKGADISDDSEVFNISAGQQPGSSSKLKAAAKQDTGSQLKPGAGIATPIFVIDRPSEKDIWIVGKTYTIQWRVADIVDYPLSVFLVTADKKLPVNDLGKAGSAVPGLTRPTSKQWRVNDNLYEEKYRIRLTSADGKYEIYSKPFLVKATWPSDFTVDPSVVVNMAHRTYRHTQEPEWRELLSMGTKLFDPFPDPGGETSKIGFQCSSHVTAYEKIILRYRHRSFVFYDLTEIKNKLTHEATVKTVQFYYVPAGNSPQSCPAEIWCLDAKLPGGATADAFASHPKHLLGNDMQVLTWSVQRWLDNPSSFNHGVLIKAADEGPEGDGALQYPYPNVGQCIQLGKWQLKFRLEEKLTK